MGVAAGLRLQPFFQDFRHLFSIECLVSEQMVSQRGEGGPVIVTIQAVVQLDGNLFQIVQPLSLQWVQQRSLFPRSVPIRGPLGDHSRMIRVARIDHLGDRSGKADLNRQWSELFVTQTRASPDDLGVSCPARPVIVIRLDRHLLDPAPEECGHQGVARFVIGGEFGHGGRGVGGVMECYLCNQPNG